MVDLDRYGDNVTLKTSEIAEWLEMDPKSVRRLPINWLDHLRTREGRALAGDVKRAYLGRGERRAIPERGASPRGRGAGQLRRL